MAKKYNLKELIKKVKTGQVDWDTVIKVKNDWNPVSLRLSNLSDDDWEKIEMIDWWPDLEDKIVDWGAGKLLKGQPGGTTFQSENILQQFKNFVDEQREIHYCKERYGKRTDSIKISELPFSYLIDDREAIRFLMTENGGKVFGRDGQERNFQSKEAFIFFKKLTQNSLTFSFFPGSTFPLKYMRECDTEDCEVELVEKDFDFEEVEELRNEEQFSSEEEIKDLEESKSEEVISSEKKENWEDIHEKFTREWWGMEVYKPSWEKYGFDCRQTKAWVKAGLEPEEFEIAVALKEEGHNPS